MGWPLGLLTAAAVIAGLAYLVISLAPNYIAHYLVRSYFQGLAIDASGVETMDINPLRGEINFGPVTFRGAEGETGQVDRIGVKIDVTRLLHRQALIRSASCCALARSPRTCTTRHVTSRRSSPSRGLMPSAACR